MHLSCTDHLSFHKTELLKETLTNHHMEFIFSPREILNTTADLVLGYAVLQTTKKKKKKIYIYIYIPYHTFKTKQ